MVPEIIVAAVRFCRRLDARASTAVHKSDIVTALMNSEPIHLHIEKILERALRIGQNEIEVIGTDSSLAIALLLTQMSSPEFMTLPRLVVVPNAKAAEALETHLRFFSPEVSVSILPAFDVSPYSGLYPNARSISERVRWAFAAQNPKPGQIFVAPVAALLHG